MGIVSKKCYTRSCKTHANYQHWFSIQHFLSCQNPNKSSRKDFWKNSWKEISIWVLSMVLYNCTHWIQCPVKIVSLRRILQKTLPSLKWTLQAGVIWNQFKKLNIVNCQINCKFRVILKAGLLCLRKILSNDFVFLVCISIYISRKPFISIWMNMGFKSIYWNKRHCNVGCIILTRQLVTELSREPWVAGARELAV